MKTPKIIIILIAFSLIISGCDNVRSVLGMPTSAQLKVAQKKEIARVELKRIEDSVSKVKSDSIKLVQEIIANGGYSLMLKRYYVIVGSFKVEENAAKKVEQIKIFNLNPEYLNFKNGFKVVSAMSTDNQDEANETVINLIDLGINKEEIWIYDKSQKLHIE